MTPISFGRYQLLEKIGAGGMAEVFRARTTGAAGFERIVAIKCIHRQLVGDAQFLAMFIDEAKIAVQLHHANIAQVFDLGMVDDRYYIALEHVHGRDLKRVFLSCYERREALPIAHACFIAMEMLSGLDYAHNQRSLAGEPLELVHRDISLQNVLVSFDGDVKLIDFGIAKAAGRSAHTQAGFVKGKFAYMSPEQLRGLPVDRRSDVFSAGTVLYEMLTGKRLFLSESTLETVKRVREADVPPARSLNPAIPEELEAILSRALAKLPDDRYASAGAFYDALEGFVRKAGIAGSRRYLAAWLRALLPVEYEADSARLVALNRAASESDGDDDTAFGIDDADVIAERAGETNSVEILFDDEPDAADSLVATMPVPRFEPAEILGNVQAPVEGTLVGFRPPPRAVRAPTAPVKLAPGTVQEVTCENTDRVVGPLSRRAATEIGSGIVDREQRRLWPLVLALTTAVVVGVGAGLWALSTPL